MRLLDLFCGAGGCAVGYHRAGFADIVGVDVKPQPRYPFAFVQGDALEYLSEHGHKFDAIHASPPCQRFSQAQRLQGREHADLLTPTLELLKATGRAWVVENVPGAPMPDAVTLCGLALGVRVKRHRMFLASFPLAGTVCPVGHPGEWYTVFGGGAAKLKWDNRRRATAAEAKAAMGIDWMNRDELSQSVPPAYTEFIGRQLLDAIDAKANT
jgi:DNA (cytosine-5)-methyltransferase 1